MKCEERGADGERQDHASGDLVERGVNIFKGIVAETVSGVWRQSAGPLHCW